MFYKQGFSMLFFMTWWSKFSFVLVINVLGLWILWPIVVPPTVTAYLSNTTPGKRWLHHAALTTRLAVSNLSVKPVCSDCVYNCLCMWGFFLNVSWFPVFKTFIWKMMKVFETLVSALLSMCHKLLFDIADMFLHGLGRLVPNMCFC